jgi:hypothetical protein
MEQIMISIGQEAAVIHSGSWIDTVYFGYTVTKVTPTGQVTVTRQDGHTRRFAKDGYEMGTSVSRFRRDMVRFDVDVLQEQEDRKKRAFYAAQVINDIVPLRVTRQYSKDAMRDALNALKKQIDNAHKVVDLM